VSVKQAAIHFGTSESDIRRRIRRGELTSESIPRPGGTLLRVRLPAPDDTPAARPPVPESHQAAPEPRPDVSAALSASLAALTAALESERAERQTIAQEARLLAERAAAAEATAAAERERRIDAERELARLQAWRWYDPRTW
jgi:hypothetical protein